MNSQDSYSSSTSFPSCPQISPSALHQAARTHTASQLRQSRALKVPERADAAQRLHGTSQAVRDRAERGCSTVPWASWGFLGLPPWKRHAETTALGLQLLARPVDQHGRTTGLYQKMTAPGRPHKPTRLPRSAMLGDYSSQHGKDSVVWPWVPSSPLRPHRG